MVVNCAPTADRPKSTVFDKRDGHHAHSTTSDAIFVVMKQSERDRESCHGQLQDWAESIFSRVDSARRRCTASPAQMSATPN
jgi:hypothetical protein